MAKSQSSHRKPAEHKIGNQFSGPRGALIVVAAQCSLRTDDVIAMFPHPKLSNKTC